MAFGNKGAGKQEEFNAAQAAFQAAQLRAKSKTAARSTVATIDQYRSAANASLANATLALAKAGNLGIEKQQTIDVGAPELDARDSYHQEGAGIRENLGEQIDELQEEADAYRDKAGDTRWWQFGKRNRAKDQARAREGTIDELEEQQEAVDEAITNTDAIGRAISDREIQPNESSLYASGSDLLSFSVALATLESGRETIRTSGIVDIFYTLLDAELAEQGVDFNIGQSAYARQAQRWQNTQTVLNYAFQIGASVAPMI